MVTPYISLSVIGSWSKYKSFVDWCEENPPYGVNTYAERFSERFEALSWIKDEVAEKDRIDQIIKIINFGYEQFLEVQNGPQSEPGYVDRNAQLFNLWLFLWFINRDSYMKKCQDDVKQRVSSGIRGFRVRSNERSVYDPRPLFSFGSIPLGERPYWEFRPEVLKQLCDVAVFIERCPDLWKKWRGTP
jgi:hypothetical protein